MAKTFDPQRWNRTLFDALIDARGETGTSPALEDPDRTPISRQRLILASFVLGKQLAAMTKPGERVGVLLPNVNAVAIAIFSLLAYGRVPAMLNFTSSANDLGAGCRSIEAKVIVTSRKFVATARLKDKLDALPEGLTIVYLEDLQKRISLVDRIRGLIDSWRPSRAYEPYRGNPEDIAMVLFTSGTERAPKAVALTHANILSNVGQALALFGFTSRDVLFNPLPVFHAFGLMAGLFLPLFAGFEAFLYPSPLHYDTIPKLFREKQATILIGIDTFAGAWGKAAGEDDFKTARLVVLGAERVREATREIWQRRFGIGVLEGYGATEASPVIAVNPLEDNRAGTAGRLLPGIETRLEPVPGIETGARLSIRGPNVMAGYYFPGEPGKLIPPPGGWYDTGDIVTIDADHYVTIIGRAKRFAKISGEMISLAAVERFVAETWPDHHHAVVALPDPKRGEALYLVTDAADASRRPLLTNARRLGFSNVAIPDRIVTVEKVPLLGNGKVDYTGAEKLAAAWLAEQPVHLR